MLIERNFRKWNDTAVRVNGVGIQQFLYNPAALNKMLFGNRLCVFGGHLGIERALGINYHNRSERAKPEAACLYY